MTEHEERKRGELLIEVLGLRPIHSGTDLYQTAWGTKSTIGLYRTVRRIILKKEAQLL